jgi:hypothetical protein
MLLVTKNEVMHIRSIPVSGRVIVRRGYQGTSANLHASGERFWVGTPEQIDAVRNDSKQFIGYAGSLPNVCVPGTKAFDDKGNEYLLVDMTATVVPGATVVVSRDGSFTASIITSTSRGIVGITIDNGTSDQWVWILRAGSYAHAKMVGGSSLVTSDGEFQGATSVSTPSVGLLGRSSSARSSNAEVAIRGMWATGAATTASTSATSETGFYAPVWLEFPYMDGGFTS